MIVWLTSKVIIEIAVFILIIADSIGYLFYNRNNFDSQDKRTFLRKTIMFYVLAWSVIGLFEMQIQFTNQLIHGVIIFAAGFINVIGILLVKPASITEKRKGPTNLASKKFYTILLIASAITIILGGIGLTTEKLKDFSFTGSNVMVIKVNSDDTDKKISQVIESSIDHDVLKVKRLSATPTGTYHYLKIEFNSSSEITDSVMERKLSTNLKPFIESTRPEDFILSRARFDPYFNAKSFDSYAILLLAITIGLLIFYSFFFKNIIKGIKLVVLQNFTFLITLGFLLFAQKVIPNYVLDEHFFQIMTLFVVLCIYNANMYIPDYKQNKSVFKTRENDLLLVISTLVISIPLWIFYHMQIALPFMIICIFGWTIPYLGEKVIYGKRNSGNCV